MSFEWRFPSVRAVGRMLGVGAGILLGFFVFAAILQSLVTPFFDSQESPAFIAAVLIAQFVGAVGIAVAYMAAADRWNLVNIRTPSEREWKWIGGTLVFMLAGALGGELVFQAAGVELSENVVGGVFEQGLLVQLAFIPLSFLVVGVSEELLFRGVLQTRFAETIGGDAAVVVVTFLFILLHVPAYAMSGGAVVPAMTLLFVIGLGLGIAYEYTRNLVVPIVIHGTFNVVSLFVEVYLVVGAVV